ncbi:MAG: alpha/beta hydrolase [Pseudooceanicola atlanticus]
MTVTLKVLIRIQLAALLVAACTPVLDQVGIDNALYPALGVPGIRAHEIFIATTRQGSSDEAVFFSGQRSQTLGLASVTVTVPPSHDPGKLERPKRLPPDPTRDFTIVQPEVYEQDQDFVQAIDRALARRAPQDRDVMLFVHGYNTTMSVAALRITQFVEDGGFKGVPVLFSWASAGRTTRYVYDLNSALAARHTSNRPR